MRQLKWDLNINDLFIRHFTQFKLPQFSLLLYIILKPAIQHMSHFFLYPLLLSQGYQPFQIQQILHSFGLLPNHPIQNHSFPLPPHLRHSFTPNLIIQQNSLSRLHHQGNHQNHGFQPYNDQPSETHDLIKEEHVESQQKTSDRIANDKGDSKSQQTKKNKKKKRIVKMTLKQKRQKQLKRNQTENSKRNVIPNEIHQMLSILFKKKKSATLVQKLINKYSIVTSLQTLSVQRFYLYQSLLKEKINHYANERCLRVLLEPLEPGCRIYQKEEQLVYCKMGLSLISYFLSNDANLVILNSKRIKSENKLEHLKTKRYLSCVLSQLIKSRRQNFSD